MNFIARLRAFLKEKEEMETIMIEVGKEYKLVVKANGVVAANAGTAIPMPDLKVGDVFDWTPSHRTTRGMPTPVGRRVVIGIDSAVNFIVAASGRHDRTGVKMLKKDCAYVERAGIKIWSR